MQYLVALAILAELVKVDRNIRDLRVPGKLAAIGAHIKRMGVHMIDLAYPSPDVARYFNRAVADALQVPGYAAQDVHEVFVASYCFKEFFALFRRFIFEPGRHFCFERYALRMKGVAVCQVQDVREGQRRIDEAGHGAFGRMRFLRLYYRL